MASKNNKWMIQIPRAFNTFYAKKEVKNFQEVLDSILLIVSLSFLVFFNFKKDIFEPLFAATMNPAANPNLTELLKDVSGFDSTGDEGNLGRFDNSYPFFFYSSLSSLSSSLFSFTFYYNSICAGGMEFPS